MTLTREQWLQERKKGIGGSDAAAVLGLNPYMTNVDLWKIKTGRKEQEDISEKPFVKYGTEAEKHLIALFTLDFPEYEVIHADNDLIRHPQYEFLHASLDGRLIEKATGRRGILEIKTTNILQSMQNEKWNDSVPQNYFCQVLHYLNVTGFDFAILKAQLKTEWQNEIRLTTRHYYFNRMDFEEDINVLAGAELKFWQHVINDTEPNLILPAI
ncbi:MAG: YqaJ viral recombinase family protein [Alphaproteobacteria bacterium]|nr:YqaJ viral recombinase family protein [Alphaproteobacteria bacterium]